MRAFSFQAATRALGACSLPVGLVIVLHANIARYTTIEATIKATTSYTEPVETTAIRPKAVIRRQWQEVTTFELKMCRTSLVHSRFSLAPYLERPR